MVDTDGDVLVVCAPTPYAGWRHAAVTLAFAYGWSPSDDPPCHNPVTRTPPNSGFGGPVRRLCPRMPDRVPEARADMTVQPREA